MSVTSRKVKRTLPHPQSCECQFCLRGEMDLLALKDVELRQAKPATDEEWAEFLNAEFPRVTAGRT